MKKLDIIDNEKVANSYGRKKYYEVNQRNVKETFLMENEFQKFRVSKQTRVTEIIEEDNNVRNVEKVFKIVKKIYEKNKIAAFSENEKEENIYNTHLINLVASIPILIIAYAKVIKNKSITTFKNSKNNIQFNLCELDQKNFLNSTKKSINPIGIKNIKEVSKLITGGKYIWGTGRQIDFDKSQKFKGRKSFTLPIFIDEIVQEAIKYILLAIYEPYFDQMHCLLGFRTNRSVQQVISALTNQRTQGLDIALEGNINSAYNKVSIKKLLKILGRKIKDQKLLNLLKNKLNYDLEKDIFRLDENKLSQVGIDSLYLWNIYLLELDKFIMKNIKRIIVEINIKAIGCNSERAKILNRERYNLSCYTLTLSKILNWIHKKKKESSFKEALLKLQKIDVKKWYETDSIFPKRLNGVETFLRECNIEESSEKEIMEFLQKRLKVLKHRINRMPFANENKKYLRLAYYRYTDKWIILTNLKGNLLRTINRKISVFLEEELNVPLLGKKILITNLKKNSAHFLGFEIKTYRNYKIEKKVFVLPDKQSLIDRLNINGYCEADGFPREITKLNNLEAVSIIEKINSVLLSIINYYANFIKNPRTNLNRWIYIIRYSCIKTLALKYKMSTRQILKKFRSNITSKTEIYKRAELKRYIEIKL